MLCFYHDDLDGRCAAAIVRRHACGAGRYLRARYHEPLPVHRVDAGEPVVIVDFSYPPPVMQRLREHAGPVVWIDHHASAIEAAAGMSIPGIREVGRAACELAWTYYFPDILVPRAVKLVGDRDVWTWRYGEETAAFCEGIRLWPHEPAAPVWDRLFDQTDDALQTILDEGAICRRYQQALGAEFIEAYGFETELDGHRCYAANLKAFGSDVFGDRVNRYPFCVCYVHDGQTYHVSLYAQDFDVLPIALRYGGGGHRGAAGFTCRRLPFRTVNLGKEAETTDG